MITSTSTFLDELQSFTYQGSIVDTSEGTNNDVRARILKQDQPSSCLINMEVHINSNTNQAF